MAKRAKWELSAGAFEQLLRVLAPDREAAGEKYETIREGLLRFFAHRVGGAADALADETIDRVCRRVVHGEIIARPGAYFLAVARNVLREHLKTERRRDSLAIAAAEEMDAPVHAPLPEDVQLEQLGCLRECLHLLSAADRTLVQRYYGASGPTTAAVGADRMALAEQMGITPGALRVRAHRARTRLEACYRNCAARAPGLAGEHQGGDGD